MSDQAIVAALQTHLRAFAEAQGLRIAYEGAGFSPSASEIYLIDAHLPAKPFNPDLAARRTRHIGIYQVTVNAPSKANPVEIRSLVDAVVAHFPRLLRIVGATATVHVRDVPSRGPMIPSPDRVTVPISISYRADFLRQ